MAINKYMLAALKLLSYTELDISESYETLRRLKSLRGISSRTTELYSNWDHLVRNGDHDVPVRIFAPHIGPLDSKVLLFFHGGGWVTGDIDSYSGVCSNLAKATGHTVASVDYRLAPEYRFPAGLDDCYAVAKELFENPELLCAKAEEITLIGDSAGGNLAAAVSLMARDRGEFFPKKQILLYPATHWNHSQSSSFDSVRENGTDYLLTSKRIEEYMQLYMSGKDDIFNPYFAPLMEDSFSNQPDTLVITAQYDPLRDEGEEYARQLAKAGNRSELYRMPDALHGFFSLPPRFSQVKKTISLINAFINAESRDK